MAIFRATAVRTSNSIDLKVNEITHFLNANEFMQLANYYKIFLQDQPIDKYQSWSIRKFYSSSHEKFYLQEYHNIKSSES
jgi:hypothetical protein